MFRHEKDFNEGKHQEAFDRLKSLAMGKSGDRTAKKKSLHESYNVNNGKTYGIVREMAKYYIMEKVGETETPESYQFIGGIQNKKKYQFNNYQGAQKTLKEMVAHYGGGKLNEQVAAADPEQKPQPQQPAPQAQPQTQQPTPQAAPQQDQPADVDVNVDVEGGEEGGDVAEDNLGEINSLVGKLGEEMRSIDLAPTKKVTILKQVLSALDLSDVDMEERDELALRVKRGKGGDVKGYETAGEEDQDVDMDVDVDKDVDKDVDMGGDEFDMEEMYEHLERLEQTLVNEAINGKVEEKDLKSKLNESDSVEVDNFFS